MKLLYGDVNRSVIPLKSTKKKGTKTEKCISREDKIRWRAEVRGRRKKELIGSKMVTGTKYFPLLLVSSGLQRLPRPVIWWNGSEVRREGRALKKSKETVLGTYARSYVWGGQVVLRVDGSRMVFPFH